MKRILTMLAATILSLVAVGGGGGTVEAASGCYAVRGTYYAYSHCNSGRHRVRALRFGPTGYYYHYGPCVYGPNNSWVTTGSPYQYVNVASLAC